MSERDVSDDLERPATLREATWRFLLDGLSHPAEEALPAWVRQLGYTAADGASFSEVARIIGQRPGRALVALDVLSRPELLKGTALALKTNGVECVITGAAANALARSDDVVVIDELGTGKQHAVGRVRLIEAIMRSDVFDQLDPPAGTVTKSRPHRRIEHVATTAEWEEIVGKLEKLSLTQVRTLANRLGLEFTDVTRGGIEKEDYINVLAETYWDDFEQELRRIEANDYQPW